MSLASRHRRWLEWSSASANRRIFAASAVIGSLSLLTLVAGILKDMVVANHFGRGDDIEAFLVAFMLPAFATTVVAGSLNATLIPTVVQVAAREGDAAATRVFSSAALCALGLLFATSVVLAAIFPLALPWIAVNFDPDKRALTRSLFHLLLPTIAVSGIATVWSGMLNAGRRFAVAAAAPLLVPAVTIVSLLAFARYWGVEALVAGTVAGMIAQCVLLAIALRGRGLPVLPRWHGMSPPLRSAIRQFLPMGAGAILMGGTGLVDQAMAAMLDPGSVAALNYGGKLASAMVGLGATALGTALLPHFSHMIATGDLGPLRHSIATWSRLVFLTSLGATVLFVALSEPLVRLVFERGAFSREDTRVVALVQTFYLLQVPFYLLGIIHVRAISALQRNSILMWGAVISLSLNIVMNLILMRLLGVAGIALSTAIVYLVAWIYLRWNVGRCLSRPKTP